MAKVKTAKETITAYMKAKGWDASEIRSAFDELDSADADLNTLSDALQKNEQWMVWYNTAAPEIQKLVQERDTYKGKLDKLQAAGFSFEQAQAVAQGAPNVQGQPQATDLEQFKQNLTQGLAKASSDIMKDLIKINFKHFKEFGNEADLDAMEKLMEADPTTGRRKAYTAEEAYRVWAEPLYKEKSEKDTQKKIDEGIKVGVQAEMSKVNVPGIRRQKSVKDIIGVENAPLDKPAPATSELRDAFFNDLNEAN